MKTKVSIKIILLLGVALSGCSSTSEKGVTISRPFDIFSATPMGKHPGATDAALAPRADTSSHG